MNASLKNQENETVNKKPKSKNTIGGKRGLGRGLDALFGDEEDASSGYEDITRSNPVDENNSLVDNASRKVVGIEKLIPASGQPRKLFDEQALKTLSDSIEKYGLLQPILVRPSQTQKGCYEIVAGERRWRASQKAQLHEVPIVIRDLDETETFQISLVENLQRQDLTPIEEAHGYQRLVEEFDHSHEDIGKVLGRSRSHVANMIRLLDLPSSVQTMVELKDISAGHARALLKSDNAYDLALHVIEKNLSVRDTEKLVADDLGRDIQHRNATTKTGQKGFATKDADLLALEKQITDNLGMGVTLDMKTDNQAGKMTINFRDLGQLDDIIKRLENPSDV